tara:strand:+ start:431 stop:670 length:240 start_codon:yes stop_codon:yes gene_type:complete
MNTENIPEGWWLNVTLMASINPSWIVGVIRRGKSSWVTEHIISDLPTSKEAYERGMEFIENYQLKKKINLINGKCDKRG